MSGLSRETRLQIMLGQDELAAIDDWRFQQRMPSRASAIRELLRLALRIAPGVVADPSRRSQDFGLLDDRDLAARPDDKDKPPKRSR